MLMKNGLLLFLSIFCWSNVAISQLANGSILQENLIGTDLVSGENIDVFDILDNNQSVVLHFFTSWSSSAWSFHQSNILQNLETEYGLNGSDQLRIIAVEIDDSTSADDISNGNGAMNTKGDWTSNNDFIFIDDANWASIFNEFSVPALYVVRPNRAILNMTSQDISNRLYDEDFWPRAIGLAGLSDDVFMIGKLQTSSHCENSAYQTVCRFLNLGTTNITSASFELLLNNENIDNFDYTGQLAVFKSATVETNTISIDETSHFTARPISANGTSLPEAFSNFINGTAYYDVIEPSSFIVRVNTDYYPAETSGTLTTDTGLELLSFGPFETGDEDQWGGGGPDANTSHDFVVDLPWPQSDISCLTITVNDEAGDGFQYWDGETPPGIQILTLGGDVIKDQYEDRNFGTTFQTQLGVDVFSSIQPTTLANPISIFPNPADTQTSISWKSEDQADAIYELYNEMGDLVLSSSIKNSQQNLTTEHYPNGIYTLCIKHKEGKIFRRLVICH